VSAPTQTPVDVLEREWWARLPRLVLVPADVFAGLADESREAGDARQEPLVAVAFLAGVSMFLSLVALEPPYDRYRLFSTFTLVLQSILGGALVGLSNFWLGGALVYLGSRGAGALSGYRLARHVAGLATAPFILSLVLVWPVRLALYGGDIFRTGGSDDGAGGNVFRGIDAALLLWTVALVLIGIRETQRWPWMRATAALGVAVLFAILLGTLAYAASR
jgi:Yip1 domain